MAFGQLSLKGRALRLLAGREHSRHELERRLAEHESDPAVVKQALDDLQARGFIDEQRVVDSILHRRAGKLGAGRIRQELQAKGLDADRVATAVADLQATELQRATAVWRKRFDSPPRDTTERAKQGRFLAARGFSADVVRRLLSRGPADESAGE